MHKFLIMELLPVFVNDANNIIADKGVDVALNFIKRNAYFGMHVDGFYNIQLEGDNAKALLES